MSCACSHARSQVSSRSQLRYATVLRGRSLELAPSRAIHRDRFSRFAEVIAVAFSAISRKAGAVALATRASCGSLRLRWQVAALSRDRSWRIAGFFVVIFREPASLSRSPLRVCELHRSRFREFVKCITLAFEQVCDLHAVAFTNHAVLSRLLLRASRNHRDRFRDSQLAHRVRSFKHTASSRLRLRVRGRHRDRSGDSQKSSRSPFAISRNSCDRFRDSQQFHRGRFREHTASSQSRLRFAESLAVASCNSRDSSRSLLCEVADTLRSLLRGRGKKESMALKRLGGRGGWRQVLRDFLRVVLRVNLGPKIGG